MYRGVNIKIIKYHTASFMKPLESNCPVNLLNQYCYCTHLCTKGSLFNLDRDTSNTTCALVTCRILVQYICHKLDLKLLKGCLSVRPIHS